MFERGFLRPGVLTFFPPPDTAPELSIVNRPGLELLVSIILDTAMLGVTEQILLIFQVVDTLAFTNLTHYFKYCFKLEKLTSGHRIILLDFDIHVYVFSRWIRTE